MNEDFERLKMQVNGPLPKRGHEYVMNMEVSV